MAKVPKRFYAFENGVKVLFKTREELNAFLKEKGKAITANYESSDIDVVIDIKLPRNTNTQLTSVYGIVEVAGFEGPIKVDATYGGIDARLSQRAIGKLTMTNRFGKIYTDFKLKPEEIKERQFYTAINTIQEKGLVMILIPRTEIFISETHNLIPSSMSTSFYLSKQPPGN